MHTLSMIDTSSKAYEAIAPAKPVEPKREGFKQALKEKQEPRAERAERPQQAEQREKPEQAAKPEQARESKDVAEQQPVGEAKQTEQKEVAQKPETQEAAQDQTEVAPKVQHLVINLLKTIAAGETPESIEEFGSIEEMLTQLVQQLDSNELPGEQVLAGIDLSSLVEQLQAIAAEDGGEEQVAQLVSHLEEQLSNDAGLLANAELLAAAMPGTDPQMTSQPMAETVAQARQILQKAIDAVSGQNPATEQEVVAEEEAVDPNLLAKDEGKEKVDPRFAELIKPREVNPESLRERVRGNNAAPVASHQAQSGEDVVAATEVKSEQDGMKITDLLGTNPKQSMENLIHQVQGNAQQQNQQAANVRTMPTTAPTIQLPSGQQVAESQVFDQVVSRMSGSFNGESGKMVLRLQPAELGSLKLELMVEGDKVRASIVAQSQQVQEVLERNLPQLRNSLAEQGLKIDQFQVDVDQRQEQQGQFENLAQQQKDQKSSQQPAWQQDLQNEEQIIPLAHLMQNGGGGISLHV